MPRFVHRCVCRVVCRPDPSHPRTKYQWTFCFCLWCGRQFRELGAQPQCVHSSAHGNGTQCPANLGLNAMNGSWTRTRHRWWRCNATQFCQFSSLSTMFCRSFLAFNARSTFIQINVNAPMAPNANVTHSVTVTYVQPNDATVNMFSRVMLFQWARQRQKYPLSLNPV